MRYKNYDIKIEQDECPDSPRNWDNLGTIFAPRNHIGEVETLPDGAIMLHLYVYSHGGETIRTSPFSCSWDSGQIGYVFCTKEDVRKEFGEDDPETIEKAKKIMENEIKTLASWMEGDVWGYVIEKDGDLKDSCWGYYGQEGCLHDAKQMVDFYVEEEEKIAALCVGYC